MSTIKADTLSNLLGTLSVPVATAVQGSAKAWVNFNGTGTVAIRASFNVSSITDNGTGDYTVNFTTAMTDANYCWSLGGAATTSFVVAVRADLAAPTSSTLRLTSYNASFFGTDAAYINVSIFR